jgi:hypothetical protein
VRRVSLTPDEVIYTFERSYRTPIDPPKRLDDEEARRIFSLRGSSLLLPPLPSPAARGKRVLIAGHFKPHVRSALMIVQAKTGKRLRNLLGEAINNLAVKYGKPQPFSVEE